MLELLDTTIRDGSYVIDFQFSAHDTSIISARLDDAGVSFIELGHGLGMGAWRKAEMRSAESDEKYMEAAATAVKKNKWGMFFIPGIGSVEDIELASKYNIDFIRIGTNVTEVESSKKYIERAKSLGIYVFANYMKTYALSPREVGKFAQQSADYGADVVCVVDSAGGMMPEEVKNYIGAVKDMAKVKIGFHGHNNMGLAVANSLIAVENGADIIDTSVRGMGRSAGNTVTEIFLLALKRRGMGLNIDTTKILNLAEKIIDPFMQNYKQVDSIAIISGYAQFHSSFQPKIFQYAAKYGIDPRELIVKLTMNDKINAPDNLLEKLSMEILVQKKEKNEIKINTSPVRIVNAKDSIEKKIAGLIIRLNSTSKKWGKSSVFNIVQSTNPNKRTTIFQSLHENDSFVMASGEFTYDDALAGLLNKLDGETDYILLDCDIKLKKSADWINKLKGTFKKTKIIPYSDIQAWAESISNLLISLFKGHLIGKKILIAGNTFLSRNVHSYLIPFGIFVELHSNSELIETFLYDAIIFCEHTDLKFNLGKNLFVIDGLIGALNNEQLILFEHANINVYRPEMTTVTLSKLQSMMSSINLVTEKQGISEINGTPIAAGGIIASRGTVIVDSVKKPTLVYGVANGQGYLLSEEDISPDDLASMQNVENWILNEALN